MTDDARALLSVVEPRQLGRTLLFDLEDEALVAAIDEAEVRGTRPSAHPGPPAHPAPWRAAEAAFDTAILAVPKSRTRLRMLLRLTASLVRPGGRLLLVAHNRGAGAAATDLAELGTVRRLGSKAHRRVLSTTIEDPPAFDLEDWVTTGTVETPDGRMPVAWLPGVFAEGRLDPGTALLLEHLPRHVDHGYDIGVGCGIVGVFMAKRGPGGVCGLEPDLVAIEAAIRTGRLNGTGMSIAWSDSMIGHPSDPEDRLDLVMSNPPFHEGLDRTTATTERLLREAAGLLRPDGELRIVANRFLRYDRVLEDTFAACEVLADDGRYRVWRAWRPR